MEDVPSSFSSLQNLEARDSGTSPERELLSVDLVAGCHSNGLTASVSGPLQTSSPMVPLPSFRFKPLSSPKSLIIIQNLRIPGTIMAKEHRGTGSHPYTLYTVKLGDAEAEREGSPGLRGEVGGCGCQQNNLPGASIKDSVVETALADLALDIMCLLMKDQWSWLCTDNIRKTIQLLFGTLIDSWLNVSVANLT